MKRKRRINGKLLKKGEFIAVFAVITVITLLKASANTIFANPQENNQVIVNNQDCHYTAQSYNQLSTPNPSLPLEVVVFIDESSSADEIDPMLPINNNIPFRYQLLHLIANFLLLDGELRLRDVGDNYLSVWAYSSDTVKLIESSPVNTNTIDSFEQLTNYDFEYSSYVDFHKLLNAIETSVDTVDNGLPVVLLINDPYPNGGDVSGTEFATTAYEDWREIPTDYEKSFYLLDFSVRTPVSSNARDSSRDRWRREFFKEDVHGQLLSVTEYNQLATIARIIEEVVGQPLFYPLTANSLEVHVPPLADRVDFGFIYNQKPSDSAHWTPSAIIESGNTRASLEGQSSNSLFYKAENPRRIWNLPENNLNREVLYAYQFKGGLTNFTISTNPPTTEGYYLSVQAQFVSGSSVDPEVHLYSTDDSVEIAADSVRQHREANTYVWHIGPIYHDDQPTAIELSLESLEKPPFTCTFTVLPMPELTIESSSEIPENEEPFELGINIVNADHIADLSSSSPSVYITKADESDDIEIQSVATVEFSTTVNNTAIYNATFESIELLDPQQSWKIVAELNAIMNDGLPINLQDEITLLLVELNNTVNEEERTEPTRSIPTRSDEPVTPIRVVYLPKEIIWFLIGQILILWFLTMIFSYRSFKDIFKKDEENENGIAIQPETP